jgi:hypothetical protein
MRRSLSVRSPFPSRKRGILVGLWGLVVLLLVLVLVGAARGGDTPPRAQRCTHGSSSIGPVEIVDGRVVGGSLTPQTEACLQSPRPDAP